MAVGGRGWLSARLSAWRNDPRAVHYRTKQGAVLCGAADPAGVTRPRSGNLVRSVPAEVASRCRCRAARRAAAGLRGLRRIGRLRVRGRTRRGPGLRGVRRIGRLRVLWRNGAEVLVEPLAAAARARAVHSCARRRCERVLGPLVRAAAFPLVLGADRADVGPVRVRLNLGNRPASTSAW